MKRLFKKTHHAADLGSVALTPMVDLFTILVIAVLRASSPEPPVAAMENDFQLPISKSEIQSQKSAAIEIAANGIALEGVRIGSTIYWAKQKDVLIGDLKAALLLMSPKRLQIRADANAPWSVVNKALYTAQEAGIKDVEIIALSASSL